MRTNIETPAGGAADATMLRGLRRLRKAAGLSQEETAAALGVSRVSYGCWETLRAMPTAKNVIALMNLFHCSIEELFREED